MWLWRWCCSLEPSPNENVSYNDNELKGFMGVQSSLLHHEHIMHLWFAERERVASAPSHWKRILKPWSQWKGHDKRHVQDDINSKDYRSPYTLKSVPWLRSHHKMSIEHVLPRSMINGRAPGNAENDPVGWDLADRDSNSSRSSLPLVLWRLPLRDERYDHRQVQGQRQLVESELHYVPPLEMRARLARKWLYVRATYAEEDTLAPPSNAQWNHRDDILRLVRETPPSAVEHKMDDAVFESFGLCNPLVHDGSHMYINSEEWRERVFGNYRYRY